MATGTVKWFNPVKGVRFFTPAEGGADALVTVSAVERAGPTTSQEGQRVNFELQSGRNGKRLAEKLAIAE